MILEQGILPVVPGQEVDFEDAFAQAQPLIANSPGCISVQLQRCEEQPNEYLLLVQWETIEDHLEGFRGSEAFGQWRALLQDFYASKPEMRHFHVVAGQTGIAG